MSPKVMTPTTKKSAVRISGTTDQSKTTIKNPKSSKTMTSGNKILHSSSYDQFVACPFNRDTKASLLRKIKATMSKYGFLHGYPLHCWQGTGTQKGKLVIKDGQHRFEAAKELGLPIAYIINTREPLRW